MKVAALQPPDSADKACRPLPVSATLPEVDPTAWDVRRRRALRRAAGTRARSRASGGGIAVLMLDVGGVVIPSLFESVGLPGFPAGPLAGEPDWRRVERGETSERAYWDALSGTTRDLDVASLWQRCSRVRGELAAVLDLLARKVRLVAFTNDMAHFFGEDWPGRFPELSVFDELVEAGRLGVHKPDPEAFRAAARAVGERPEGCLFVDDLAVNLAGAREAGMHVRLFDVRDPAASVAAIIGDLRLDANESVAPARIFRKPVG